MKLYIIKASGTKLEKETSDQDYIKRLIEEGWAEIAEKKEPKKKAGRPKKK